VAVGRALASAAVPVYGFDSDPLEIGHFSSSFSRSPSQPSRQRDDTLLDSLRQLARAGAGPPALFPAGDDQIEWVARNYEALAPHFRLQGCARPDVAKRFVDKRSFYSWMQETEAETPRTCFPESEADLQASASDLRFPVILKPARGHAWRRHLRGAKVIEVADAAALFSVYREQARFDPAMVVQEVIPGPERDIAVAACAAAEDGTVLGVFTARKSRQYPYLYGSASYCVSEWLPDVADLSLDLLARLGFRGLCGTEYKKDPRTGRWVLIEINPRPTLWFDLSRASGVNLVESVYRDLVGLPRRPFPRQRDGVVWRYLARDWVACLKAWRRGDPDAPGLGAALRWPDTEAICSAREPLSCLIYPFYLVAHAARHLFGG